MPMRQPDAPQAVAGERHLVIDDIAAHGAQRGQRLAAQVQDARLHGQVAVPVAQPADALVAQVGVQRGGELRRVVAQ
ncbi:hypothetical protein G6F57_022061 [Rhizopus arrhizus]|nr:hypothetical protein G6F57_022061 [Rhizopus arrhizus]